MNDAQRYVKKILDRLVMGERASDLLDLCMDNPERLLEVTEMARGLKPLSFRIKKGIDHTHLSNALYAANDGVSNVVISGGKATVTLSTELSQKERNKLADLIKGKTPLPLPLSRGITHSSSSTKDKNLNLRDAEIEKIKRAINSLSKRFGDQHDKADFTQGSPSQWRSNVTGGFRAESIPKEFDDWDDWVRKEDKKISSDAMKKLKALLPASTMKFIDKSKISIEHQEKGWYEVYVPFKDD